MNEPHRAAGHGYQRAAEVYARGRPAYPQPLIAWLRDELGVGAATRVVDLGAGTGLFTHLLLHAGAAVTAVEPVAAMRAQLSAALPEVRVIDGTAQSMALPSASCEVMVCAQAFHWFASPASLAEMHRVIAPGGRLGLVWNERDASLGWVRDLAQIVNAYEDDAPRFHTGGWRRAFAQAVGSQAPVGAQATVGSGPPVGAQAPVGSQAPIGAGAPFGPLRETCMRHAHVGPPREVILDRCLSVSFIAALPEAERLAVAQRICTLIDTHPDLKGRSEVSFPYVTRAYACSRLR